MWDGEGGGMGGVRMGEVRRMRHGKGEVKLDGAGI
jgi:hypothetical protein